MPKLTRLTWRLKRANLVPFIRQVSFIEVRPVEPQHNPEDKAEEPDADDEDEYEELGIEHGH